MHGSIYPVYIIVSPLENAEARDTGLYRPQWWRAKVSSAYGNGVGFRGCPETEFSLAIVVWDMVCGKRWSFQQNGLKSVSPSPTGTWSGLIATHPLSLSGITIDQAELTPLTKHKILLYDGAGTQPLATVGQKSSIRDVCGSVTHKVKRPSPTKLGITRFPLNCTVVQTSLRFTTFQSVCRQSRLYTFTRCTPYITST